MVKKLHYRLLHKITPIYILETLRISDVHKEEVVLKRIFKFVVS